MKVWNPLGIIRNYYNNEKIVREKSLYILS